MIINDVYQLVLFISNKEQRGDFPPSKFNLLARAAQLQYISKRVGNVQIMTPNGVPQIGYQSTWRINEDLRRFVVPPVQIPINNQGNFAYPYGYIWPDAIMKNDFREIKRITQDQYPAIKWSQIIPPTEEYPVCIFSNPYGFIDPYSIGSFKMSYLATPPDPIWNFYMDGNIPKFQESGSVDFLVSPMGYLELVILILQQVGVNLSADMVEQYAIMKEQSSL